MSGRSLDAASTVSLLLYCSVSSASVLTVMFGLAASNSLIISFTILFCAELLLSGQECIILSVIFTALLSALYPLSS
ncbi:hypothetical protein D3C76_1389690 [compost metagenome]